MHLRLGFLVAPRARLGLGFGHRFGSGSVRPPAADDARRDLEFQRLSWLGCLRHGQRNLVMVGLRIRGGVWAGFVGPGFSASHLLPDRRDPHELLPRYPCLRDVCLHRRHLLSRWRWHLARRGRRLGLVSCTCRMGLCRMPSLRRGKNADFMGSAEVSLAARGPRLSHYKYTWGGSPGTKLGHIHRSRMVVARRSTHHGHIGRPHGPPRSRRPARPDTHWTHTTHIQLTKLEPGPALNRVRARAC